jgi:hypothetical protein
MSLAAMVCEGENCTAIIIKLFVIIWVSLDRICVTYTLGQAAKGSEISVYRHSRVKFFIIS